MKKAEISVGGHYLARVSGTITTVRVDDIRERYDHRDQVCTVYDVTNLKTGRKTTFRSAAKFRGPAKGPTPASVRHKGGEESDPLAPETCSDPTPATPRAAGTTVGTSTCPRCGSVVVIEDGRYAYHRKPSGITCGMSGEKVVSSRLPYGGPEDIYCARCKRLTAHRVYHDGTDCSLCTEPRTMEGEQGSDPQPMNGGNGTTPSTPDSRTNGSAPTKSTTPRVVGPASAPRSATASATAPSASVSVPTASTPDNYAPIGLGTKLRACPEPATNGDGKVAGYVPTEEQAAVLAAARQPGLEVLVIAAGAGAGKTSTLKMLESVLPGRGQYTAFNASLVAESKSKFRRCKVNTTHSLAFGTVGKLYAHRLGGNRVRSDEVARMLGIEPMTVAVPAGAVGEDGKPVVATKTLKAGYLAGQVMEAIRKFCQSADREISQKHFKPIAGIDRPGEYTNQNAVREALVPFAREAWTDLASTDGKLPFSHDCYVKLWQLGEDQRVPVIHADYILLDEAQDTAPVFLDVLRRQSALIILVGDDCQQIYEWRGACNAMKAFPGSPRKLLSQSFRFGQSIADVANSILADLEEPTDLVMRGCDIPSRVILPDPEGPGEESGVPCRAVLCRTNTCAVGTVLQAVKEGKRPHLIGGGAETVAFVRAAQDLQQGRGTGHPELCLFKNWGEVQQYAKEDEGSDLKLMVKLIDEYKCRPILEALEDMPAEEDADLVVSTAHKSKGREWTSVRLAPDFPPANRMGDSDRRLLYVAATRAQHLLDLSVCTPFLPGKDRESGKEIQPIRVVFTKPMPTREEQLEWLWLNGPGAEKRERQAITHVNEVEAEKLTTDPTCYDHQKTGVVDNTGAVQPRATTAPAEFTWSKYGDRWCLRGPAGIKPGTSVIVVKKSGQTSRETVGAVYKEFPDATLYQTK